MKSVVEQLISQTAEAQRGKCVCEEKKGFETFEISKPFLNMLLEESNKIKQNIIALESVLIHKGNYHLLEKMSAIESDLLILEKMLRAIATNH